MDEQAPGTPVAGYPDLPYPGRRPASAYLQADGRVLALVRGPGGTWVLEHSGVAGDDELAARGAAAVADRVPLLCYGSNACPSKLHDLRSRLGLSGPVLMTPCTVSGLAAAWCAGERLVDRSVPATLVAAPGRESHFLWWVAPDQWPVLDRCEGRGERYDLVRLPGHRVRDDRGRPVPDVLAYVGLARQRRPLRDAHGRPLLVRHLDQEAARAALRAAV